MEDELHDDGNNENEIEYIKDLFHLNNHRFAVRKSLIFA